MTPLFGVRVPVRAHALADPEKGTGVAMICTFGDITDVVWWRELGLPVRAVIQANGAFKPVTWGEAAGRTDDPRARSSTTISSPGCPPPRRARASSSCSARAAISLGEPRPITHAVKFYEKGDRPLEIVTSRQWFIKTMDFREALLAARPRARLASRPTCRRGSRTGSTASPATGASAASGSSACRFPSGTRCATTAPSTTTRGSCRPRSGCRSIRRPTCPTGYTPEQRDQPGGFTGDPDIMDTWATSSLTPQIAGGWEEDPDLFARVFPMDVRPQAHDIIRTWLFSTMLRSEFEHGTLPWKNAAISGWVLDPDRKKMSKSKGNVVTPMGLLEEHGSDGVRYWAASGRPGTDTAFDPGQMKVGRRLAIKLLNASKFVLAKPGTQRARSPQPSIAGCSPASRGSCASRPTDLEDYDYTRVLERTETFFWSFCDNYLELVKSRRYGDHGEALAGVGETGAADGAVGAAAAVRAVPAVCDRGSVVVVAGRLGAPGAVADGRRDARGRPAAPTDGGVQALQIAAAGARRDPQEEVRGAAAAQDARRTRRRACAGGKLALPAGRRSGPARGGPDSADRDQPWRKRCRSMWSSRRRRARRPGDADARMKTVPFEPLDPAVYREIVRRALAEDLGWGDVTTEATVPPSSAAAGRSWPSRHA